MSESKSTERRKKRKKAPRTERRFEAGSSKMPLPMALMGLASSSAAGVGAYLAYTGGTGGVPLAVGGLLATAAALWFGDRQARPLRVGALGLGEERADGIVRLRWCEIERVRAEADELLVEGAEELVRIPWKDQRQAAALLVEELGERVPDVLNLPREVLETLSEPDRGAGAVVDVAGLVMTGAPCAASGEPITFDADARFCPQCAEVYLAAHVPERCVRCEAAVGDAALALG